MCPDEPEPAPRSVAISPSPDAPSNALVVERELERDRRTMFMFTRVMAETISTMTAPAQKATNKTAIKLRGALFRASDALDLIVRLIEEGKISEAHMVAHDAQINANENAREIT